MTVALYFVLRRELAAAPRPVVPGRRPLVAWLHDRTWSPYAAGLLLGLVVGFSEVVCGRPLAVSGAFDKLAAYPGVWLLSSSQYYGHVMAPGITVLVQVGAGIAGGCTSGLAISGGAALAPAAFLFMAGMFAGGIPTAWLWYRGRAD